MMLFLEQTLLTVSPYLVTFEIQIAPQGLTSFLPFGGFRIQKGIAQLSEATHA